MPVGLVVAIEWHCVIHEPAGLERLVEPALNPRCELVTIAHVSSFRALTYLTSISLLVKSVKLQLADDLDKGVGEIVGFDNLGGLFGIAKCVEPFAKPMFRASLGVGDCDCVHAYLSFATADYGS